MVVLRELPPPRLPRQRLPDPLPPVFEIQSNGHITPSYVVWNVQQGDKVFVQVSRTKNIGKPLRLAHEVVDYMHFTPIIDEQHKIMDFSPIGVVDGVLVYAQMRCYLGGFTEVGINFYYTQAKENPMEGRLFRVEEFWQQPLEQDAYFTVSGDGKGLIREKLQKVKAHISPEIMLSETVSRLFRQGLTASELNHTPFVTPATKVA